MSIFKGIIEPGKFSVIKRPSPQERLKELQKIYNSQEYEEYTPKLVLDMKAWFDEMNEIVKLYPELGPIGLKTYTSYP